MTSEEIKITINGGSPLGMRIEGGSDFSTPIVVKNVSAGSKAEKAGIKSGDIIISINGNDVSRATHDKAKSYIQQSGNSINLLIKRSGGSQSSQKPESAQISAPPSSSVKNIQLPSSSDIKTGNIMVVGNPVASRDHTKFESVDNISSSSKPNAGPCYACKEDLIACSYVKLGSKNYHQHHFNCHLCQKNLAGEGFFEENDNIVCKDCFALNFSPKCQKCGNPCVERYVTASNKSFHPECFTCENCKIELSGKQFNFHDGKSYCIECLSELLSIKCDGCNSSIKPNEAYVEAQNKKFHNTCFKCSKCGHNLAEKGTYAIRNGTPQCREH